MMVPPSPHLHAQNQPNGQGQAGYGYHHPQVTPGAAQAYMAHQQVMQQHHQRLQSQAQPSPPPGYPNNVAPPPHPHPQNQPPPPSNPYAQPQLLSSPNLPPRPAPHPPQGQPQQHQQHQFRYHPAPHAASPVASTSSQTPYPSAPSPFVGSPATYGPPGQLPGQGGQGQGAQFGLQQSVEQAIAASLPPVPAPNAASGQARFAPAPSPSQQQQQQQQQAPPRPPMNRQATMDEAQAQMMAQQRAAASSRASMHGGEGQQGEERGGASGQAQAQMQALYEEQQHQQRIAGAAVAAANFTEETDQRTLFHSYILDYLQKTGFHSAAAAFLADVPSTPTHPLTSGRYFPSSSDKPLTSPTFPSSSTQPTSPNAAVGPGGSLGRSPSTAQPPPLFRRSPSTSSPVSPTDHEPPNHSTVGSTTSSSSTSGGTTFGFERNKGKGETDDEGVSPGEEGRGAPGQKKDGEAEKEHARGRGEVVPAAQVQIGTEQGFLYEWWTVFWDVFRAKAGKGGSTAARLFVETSSAAAELALRREALAEAARGAGAGTVPRGLAVGGVMMRQQPAPQSSEAVGMGAGPQPVMLGPPGSRQPIPLRQNISPSGPQPELQLQRPPAAQRRPSIAVMQRAQEAAQMAAQQAVAARMGAQVAMGGSPAQGQLSRMTVRRGTMSPAPLANPSLPHPHPSPSQAQFPPHAQAPPTPTGSSGNPMEAVPLTRQQSQQMYAQHQREVHARQQALLERQRLQQVQMEQREMEGKLMAQAQAEAQGIRMRQAQQAQAQAQAQANAQMQMQRQLAGSPQKNGQAAVSLPFQPPAPIGAGVVGYAPDRLAQTTEAYNKYRASLVANQQVQMAATMQARPGVPSPQPIPDGAQYVLGPDGKRVGPAQDQQPNLDAVLARSQSQSQLASPYDSSMPPPPPGSSHGRPMQRSASISQQQQATPQTSTTALPNEPHTPGGGSMSAESPAAGNGPGKRRRESLAGLSGLRDAGRDPKKRATSKNGPERPSSAASNPRAPTPAPAAGAATPVASGLPEAPRESPAPSGSLGTESFSTAQPPVPAQLQEVSALDDPAAFLASLEGSTNIGALNLEGDFGLQPFGSEADGAGLDDGLMTTEQIDVLFSTSTSAVNSTTYGSAMPDSGSATFDYSDFMNQFGGDSASYDPTAFDLAV
ncbi:hypothetical protein JCM1840_002195 [Sporobolomyces johnsonii]